MSGVYGQSTSAAWMARLTRPGARTSQVQPISPTHYVGLPSLAIAVCLHGRVPVPISGSSAVRHFRPQPLDLGVSFRQLLHVFYGRG